MTSLSRGRRLRVTPSATMRASQKIGAPALSASSAAAAAPAVNTRSSATSTWPQAWMTRTATRSSSGEKRASLASDADDGEGAPIDRRAVFFVEIARHAGANRSAMSRCAAPRSARRICGAPSARPSKIASKPPSPATSVRRVGAPRAHPFAQPLTWRTTPLPRGKCAAKRSAWALHRRGRGRAGRLARAGDDAQLGVGGVDDETQSVRFAHKISGASLVQARKRQPAGRHDPAILRALCPCKPNERRELFGRHPPERRRGNDDMARPKLDRPHRVQSLPGVGAIWSIRLRRIPRADETPRQCARRVRHGVERDEFRLGTRSASKPASARRLRRGRRGKSRPPRFPPKQTGRRRRSPHSASRAIAA